MNFFVPFGILYGQIIDLRNYLYDKGILKTYDLGARTISVGNLTTGGTGKTPLVAHITEILAENGEKVCILTRGYGRKNENERVLVSDGRQVLADAETGGDEPVELAHKLTGKAIVVADADRVAAAKWAKEKLGIAAIILDDGFQHRRAKRDLDIVCIDATNPCGNGRILPAGTLRESLKSLNRADAIVITRADQAENISDLEDRLRRRNGTAPIFKASTRIVRFVPLDEFHATTRSPHGEIPKSACAFCGVGNPESFFISLITAGVDLLGRHAFRDHFTYDQRAVESIENGARASGAESLITTAKDAVKLKGLSFTLPCNVAIADTIIDDPESFRKLITASS